jgi:hypothetical protein
MTRWRYRRPRGGRRGGLGGIRKVGTGVYVDGVSIYPGEARSMGKKYVGNGRYVCRVDVVAAGVLCGSRMFCWIR